MLLQTYFPTHTRSAIIYNSCIAFFIVAIAALPYLKTDVSVRAFASIRPASQTTIIRSAATGRVKKVDVTENQRVKVGDLLYLIESEALNEQEKFYTEKIAITEAFIRDAERALTASRNFTTAPSFTHALYRQSFYLYQQKLNEAQTALNKAQESYNRQRKLFEEKVIAAMEFENFQFDLKKAEDAISQLHETQRNQWQGELKNFQLEKQELESQRARVQKEKKMLTIKAPVSGTVQNLEGVYPGSMVFTNQELGQISPDTSLMVVAYVQPNDIGFIKQNMKVRLQVDAFNYNQWGHVTGVVTAVSQDIKIIDNKPVFEVRCSLDKDFLELKNGYKGFLKKGMTLQARFVVTQRSLWQLLYDKVDDWMNPNLR
ncbi:MAG: HlyD family secretion protein [Cyclobacteriaceae bacterium]|nr:HlyD family secretion protein [Cyclobacteriaceae bacterium]